MIRQALSLENCFENCFFMADTALLINVINVIRPVLFLLRHAKLSAVKKALFPHLCYSLPIYVLTVISPPGREHLPLYFGCRCRSVTWKRWLYVLLLRWYSLLMSARSNFWMKMTGFVSSACFCSLAFWNCQFSWNVALAPKDNLAADCFTKCLQNILCAT